MQSGTHLAFATHSDAHFSARNEEIYFLIFPQKNKRGGEGEMYGNLHYYMQNREPTRIFCMAQETQTGGLYQSREMGWGGRWEGGSKGSGYMYTYG